MTRAGIVTVVGKPNAGKSTLLNRVVGQKLSIVSPKPQSTRDRIIGIRTEGDVQMIIFDTPGLMHPKYALQRVMRATALEALRDADVIIYVVDATEGAIEPLTVAASLQAPPRAPVIMALNKADKLSERDRAALAAPHAEAIFTSATTGEGLPELLDRAAQHLPVSPFLYPEEEVSTQTLRFFVAELIRETALEQLSDEIPYSIACEIEEFREDKKPVYIRAVLHVERDSQKRILIGTKGERIKSIGQAARRKVESLLEDQSVYLDLWVKVLPNWRKNANALARFGYHLQEERQK
jgi:GTP-binding protein Era